MKQTEDYLITTSSGTAAPEVRIAPERTGSSGIGDGGSNVISVQVSLKSGEINFRIPPATPQQFYFARTRDGYFFADDLRLFGHLVSTQLDHRAVYALFQYGAIPPPLTVYKNVQRIPGGHVLTLKPNSDGHICTPYFYLKNLDHDERATANPGTMVQQELDRILSDVPESAALYFSGGVDSGLLASRLAQLGRTDIHLINYAFAQNDEESHLAQLMASHFGMKLHQIKHDPTKVSDVLQRIGEDYSFPFGDCSTVPTNMLVHESLTWANRSLVVIEGTGADGAFGVGAKYRNWARVYALPSLFRQQGNAAYRWLELWKGDSKLERFARVARKSLAMPLGLAMVAENALAGIAYIVPDETRSDLRDAIRKNFEVMSAAAKPEEQLSFLDLVWVCAGRMAPKSFDPLRKQGIQAIYPFLELPMLLASSSMTWADKCPFGETKGILKALLARAVPHKWVYRPKVGFAPTHRDLLGSPALQEFLREVVLSRENPLLDFCEGNNVRQIVERARKYQKLSAGACDFLWTLAFTSGWLAQTQRERPQSFGSGCTRDIVEEKFYSMGCAVAN